MLEGSEEQRRQQVADQQRRLAENFRAAMDESGVAPRLIAEYCGVTEQAVSNWKRTGKIRRDLLPAIAAATGWTVHRLLTGRVESRTGPPTGALTAPLPASVVTLIQQLGVELALADPATREAIAPILARLALHPQDAPHLGALVQRLLPDEPVTPVTEAGSSERAKEWTGENRRTHDEPVKAERRRPPMAVFDPEEMLKREAQRKGPKGPKIIGGNW